LTFLIKSKEEKDMSTPQKAKKFHNKGKKFFMTPQKLSMVIPTKKSQDEGYYFASGSSIDWIKAKRKLEGAFREADVWDLVYHPPIPFQEAVPGVIPPPLLPVVLPEAQLG
jgi:hypothetical protein